MKERKKIIITYIKIFLTIAVILTLYFMLLKLGLVSYPKSYIEYDFNKNIDEYSYIASVVSNGDVKSFGWADRDSVDNDLEKNHVNDKEFKRCIDEIFDNGLYKSVIWDGFYVSFYTVRPLPLRGTIDGISYKMSNGRVEYTILYVYPDDKEEGV